MNTARKILVPVNFSEDSADGLKYAVSLAQETESEIIVLHVAQKKDADSFLDLLTVMEGYPMPNRPAGIPIDRLLREKALDLYYFVQKVVRNPGRLKIRRKVALGNKAETILRVIKDESVDLVVLAVRNKSFFPYLLARGKLMKMISRFPCPVLLKPPSGEPWAASGIIRPWIFAR
jgi:nucleotide-binding universal stress UspA family protein